MALTTYAELQAEIAAFLARDDLTANIPTFITLFEAVANRRLRTRQQDASAVLASSGGWADLPDDYLAWKEVTLATGGVYPSLEYITPSALNDLFPAVPSGLPRVFTIYGTQLGVAPFDDSLGIWINYAQKIPSLATEVNWLFEEHPDLYLFGALTESQGFMVDLEKAAFWKLRRDEIFQEIEILSNKSRGVGGMRVLGPTP